jgi:predicted extracellular nuclease
MTFQRCSFRPFVVALAFLSAFFSLNGTALAATETSVIISQVYGGGGNSGATYTNDFIELFNPTASAVTLTNYSIQYGSAAGTANLTSFPLPASVTLQPGQYYLIQAAVGAGGSIPLPTPDFTITAALSATAGKIGLSDSTTALVACPTADPALADFVGFGSTANCSLGAPTATLTNTTAAIRTNVCTPTNNNAADFKSGAPVPHNTSTTLVSCGGSTGGSSLSATVKATPASAYTNTAVLLTATVAPGTQPTSTGITVTADLSSIGGTTTQTLYDDGTHGDVGLGDNVFSYSVTPTTPGSFTLPVTITDTQLRSASANIALTVQAQPSFVTIRTIQANKPSSYATQTITTSGIVVGVKSNGFYLESKDADTNPVTPEGVLIYTGSTALPSYIQIGAEIQVTGKVSTYPTTGPTPGTEIDGPQTFTLLTSGNPLPAPVTITQAMDSPTGGIYQFTKYEGMRVAIGSLTTTSGTDAVLTESTEINVSDGLFYGVVTGVPRPFREPGLSVLEAAFPAGTVTCSGTVTTNCVPLFDSNPELLQIDSKAFGRAPIDLTSNTVVTGLTGVMDFSAGTPTILLDKTSTPTLSGGLTITPVPAEAGNEFTVASFNMERFYNDVVDQDNPGSSVVTVTTEAYQRRLNKVSLAIRNVLNFPDVIGTQEIENINVLTDVANKVNSDAVTAGQTNPVYLPYLYLATDGTGINTGMLVKSTRVSTVKVEQFGLATTFTNAGGNQAVLNDRTPLVAHLGIKRGAGLPDYPITVISVHQRSLINVDDVTSTGATVRLKREAQAEYLATLIQGYQAAGEHVVTVGDYNSFEFSDGYVDTLGVTKGTPVAAGTVIQTPTAGLANPPLVDLVTLLPAAERQSYSFGGTAQVLDHVIVTSELVPTNTRLVYAHIDSDFPLINLNNANLPSRISDHDPAVAYFTVPPIVMTVTVSTTATLSKVAGGYQATITVKNTGNGTAPNVQLATATLGSATGSPVPQALGDLAGGASITTVVTFPSTAGASGARSVLSYSGTYTGGGTFGGGSRVVLP